MLTLGQLRDTASADLGLRYEGVVTALGGSGLQVTVPKLADEFSLARAPLTDFLWPHHTGYTATADPAVTTTSTTLTDTRAAWTVNQWIGYVVTCNGKTMTVTGNTATVLTGAAWSGGGTPGNGSTYTIVAPDYANWRRVTLYDDIAGVFTVNRIHSPALVVNDRVSIFLILTPAQWTEVVNQAFMEEDFIDRDTVPLVSGTTLYTLSSWIQVQEQVKRVFYEWTDAFGRLHQDDIPSYRLMQQTLTVKISVDPLVNVTTVNLIVEARRHHAALTVEADTASFPDRLALAVVRVRALKRIYSMMSEPMWKAMFAQELLDAEKELLSARKLLTPQTEEKPLHYERLTTGPELAVTSFRW